MKKESRFLLQGGIGDFLQNIAYLQSNKAIPIKCLVITHFKEASVLFAHFKIKIHQLYVFNSNEQQIELTKKISKKYILINCPRNLFFENNLLKNEKPYDFQNPNTTIGIHLGGSQFSIDMQKKFKLVPKSLPFKLIEKLSEINFNLLLFGSSSELSKFNVKESNKLKLINFENVCDSLSYVEQCKIFIGSDSAFKTMSAMLKIPTLVWLGNYEDPIRDEVFINPYVELGIIEIFKFHNLENEIEFDQIYSHTCQALMKLLSKNLS